MKWYHPHPGGIFSPGSTFYKHPQGHTQSFGFMIIFNTVKLTVKINHLPIGGILEL